MTLVEWAQFLLIILLGLTAVLQGISLGRINSTLAEMKRKRERFYKALADPETIADEMEKGARLREMKDANRTTLPRDDAVGQHAVVYRPKMRSKLPNRWRPPTS